LSKIYPFMRKSLLLLLFISFTCLAWSQNPKPSTNTSVARPKLVVGIVVDQMRWDFLYRYYDRFAPNGGFRRLLGDGFSCENTLIPYSPTYTACGHTCVYTGSVPAIHGITGNEWYDRDLKRVVYCSEDKTVKTVGSATQAGEMSPRNMFATTIGDELRLATNFRSKVIGVAIKDRGAILPAGHSANAAYWFDARTGDWVSSTYYMNELPGWLQKVNASKPADKYYNAGWNLLQPANTYVQSTEDEQKWEGKPFGADQTKFPYSLKAYTGKDYTKIATTPFGNTITEELAKAVLDGEQLGTRGITDFLAVSFSSTDYVGHTFGPNSIEAEDTYLRLDKDLGDLLNYIDKKVGKGNYLLFLTADHGVQNVPGFLAEHHLPGQLFGLGKMLSEMNTRIKEKLGVDSLIVASENYQLTFNAALLEKNKLDKSVVSRFLLPYIKAYPGVLNAVEMEDLSSSTVPEAMKMRLTNGFFNRRCGDIQIIFKPGWLDGFATGTTHGAVYPYDTHIPLLWYGWNVKPGKTNRETYMTDIASTVTAMLHIQMPSGAVGKVIEEVAR
jgi:predicted AlkP superfamily pyrophosphatase or phosphodiesterase